MAEMWWGTTTWWPGSAGTFSGGVDLRGFTFLQTANESCGLFECGNRNGEVRILSQFFLGPDRMDEVGCTFISNPLALFTGAVHASTGTNMTIFDDPKARCFLELRQIAVLRRIDRDHVTAARAACRDPREQP